MAKNRTAEATAEAVEKPVKEKVEVPALEVPGYLSLKAASDKVGIGVQTLTKMITSGRLKGYRFGKAYLIREEDLAGVEFGAARTPKFHVAGVVRLPLTCPHCQVVIETVSE